MTELSAIAYFKSQLLLKCFWALRRGNRLVVRGKSEESNSGAHFQNSETLYELWNGEATQTRGIASALALGVAATMFTP